MDEYHAFKSSRNASGSDLPFQYACKLCEFKADTIGNFIAFHRHCSFTLHAYFIEQAFKNLFEFSEQFYCHMRDTHPESPTKKTGKPRSPKKTVCVSNPRNFECSRCNVTFVCEESLRCHIRQHVTVPNKPANVAPEIYSPGRVHATQQACNARLFVDSSHSHNLTNHPPPDPHINSNNDFTLHEMQRMPFVHSVITENPAVISNSTPISNTLLQQQVQYDDASVDRMYVVSYSNNDNDNIAYRAHPNNTTVMYHHQLHDADK